MMITYIKKAIGKSGKLYDTEVILEIDEEKPSVYSNFSRYEYTIKAKDNKLSVEYNGKTIVKEMPYLKSGFENGELKKSNSDNSEITTPILLFLSGSDNFILRNSSYYWDHSDNDIKWDKAKTYLINKE